VSGPLPSLFIGSSTEGLDIAYAIQEGLEYDAEPTVWNQGFFAPSASYLQSLVNGLRRYEFAVFVFSPDDVLKLRGEAFRTAQDNVIFELGLFMGALGPDRCFYLVQRDSPELHLPSDLAGIQPLTFRAGRSDGNLVAALGPACNRVRNAIRALARQRAAAAHVEATSKPPATLERYVEMWNGDLLSKAREVIRKQGVPLSAYEVDDDSRDAWEGLKKIFYFLDSMSEAVLAGDIDEETARARFEKQVVWVWDVAVTALAPPNQADEYWEPLPAIAQLAHQWATKK